MAAVNEAWRVLGDPLRRTQYDRAQAASTASPTPPSSGRPLADDREPVGDHQSEDTVTRVVHGAPLLAMLLVLLVIFVVSALATHSAAHAAKRGCG